MTSHRSRPTASGFRPPAVPDVDMRGFWGDRIDAVADTHRA